jgi:hypothetical protein
VRFPESERALRNVSSWLFRDLRHSTLESARAHGGTLGRRVAFVLKTGAWTSAVGSRDRPPQKRTFIDHAGEKFLAGMRNADAELIATAVERQYLLLMLDNRMGERGTDEQ